MRVTLHSCDGKVAVLLPADLTDVLGWKAGDELVIHTTPGHTALIARAARAKEEK
jgi:bifunctional DNA-binding transcriptional regulator/antitoxin component of YhaV-PrlF toxin-antitoxin module